MSSKSNVLVSGAVAAVIAIVLISGILAGGILNSRVTISSSVTTVTVSNGSTLSGATEPGFGALSVLLTDPPTVPNGVTAVYLTYNDLGIHVSGAANETGWYPLNSKGTIDLMSIINVSQTISATNVQSGVFNAIGFNITSVTATFNSKNYSASLVYQQHMLIVPIAGGISISKGQISVALIDLTPTVLLLGDPTNPNFAFVPEARGYIIPAESIPSAIAQHVGRTTFLGNQSWFLSNQPQFNITNVSLNPSELLITVANVGNVPLNFRLAAITSPRTLSGHFTALPQVASISEFFVIYPNTSMIPIVSVNNETLAQMISGAGFRLPPYATVTLNFTGILSIGLIQGRLNQPVQQIIPGERYLVSVTTGNRLAQTIVTAT